MNDFIKYRLKYEHEKNDSEILLNCDIVWCRIEMINIYWVGVKTNINFTFNDIIDNNYSEYKVNSSKIADKMEKEYQRRIKLNKLNEKIH